MADKKNGAADKKSEREARLAKALRENLKRRKVGAREVPRRDDEDVAAD